MKDFIDFLKLPPNILGALAVASGALLLLPDIIIEKLFMIEFRDKYGFIIGIVFVVSSAILIVLLIAKIYHHFHDKRVSEKVLAGQIKYLQKMDANKVRLIKMFIDEPTHTLKLPMNDGLVIELKYYQIISPAGSTHMVDMVDPHINYFLQPWVMERIESNEELRCKFGL